ncbi:TAXI family TRAP transporter solute-binding subunit [Nocardiopsis sp. MG754419]|uniref:TAXI family TRAP transporter solute-binding subunit n=1 Tax=Nocardiopsis sp. MG754419 TaxID=2259865 RepID=UPI001BA5DF80|nr:TAXI family TRAP transporter solute-binding subunit [Nocardiopsis sp. MG754419]MBR8740940.1 C4-dicarboxylate ABC transporter substrate-binding protein [Nocardiopsis sp. MG754419]
MRRTLLSLAAFPASVLMLAACGAQPAEQAGEDTELGGGAVQSNLSIVTGGTSGVYYPIGGALRTIIGDNLEGQSASVEATGASVENIRLLNSGDGHLAIVQGDAADQGFTGMADFEGDPVETYSLAVLYPNVFHAVTLADIAESKGLDCFSDVVGNRYSVGDIGSGNEATTNQVFESLEISSSEVELQQLGYAETANALTNNQLDAGSWVVGEGHSGITELGTTEDIHIIEMCDEERDAIVSGYGGYTEHVIAGGTYPGIDEDVDTIAVWNALVVSGEFNEDQAYEITKAMFDHIDEVVGVYAPGEEYLVPETIENSPVPVHPGAVRFYEEQGVEIPAELLPDTGDGSDQE